MVRGYGVFGAVISPRFSPNYDFQFLKKLNVSQVHGLMFIVDAQDTARLPEVKECLYGVLSNPLIRAKPVLLLV